MPRAFRLLAIVIAGAWSVGAQQDPAQLLAEGLKSQKQGQLEQALAAYERAVALKPDSFDAQLALGKAFDWKMEWPSAREHFGKAIELAKGDERPPALGAMAVSFAFERRPRDAAAYYQRLYDLQIEAKDLNGAGETANALGRVYLECGDTANARQWYESGYETARRQRDLPGPLLDLWQMRWEHAQARIAARRGDRTSAARHLEEVRKIVEKGGANASAWPTYYALEGYLHFYAKDYRAAIASLEKADPSDAFVLGMLGQAYERAGDRAHARGCYVKVTAILEHNLQVAFSRPLALERLRAMRN